MLAGRRVAWGRGGVGAGERLVRRVEGAVLVLVLATCLVVARLVAVALVAVALVAVALVAVRFLGGMLTARM